MRSRTLLYACRPALIFALVASIGFLLGRLSPVPAARAIASCTTEDVEPHEAWDLERASVVDPTSGTAVAPDPFLGSQAKLHFVVDDPGSGPVVTLELRTQFLEAYALTKVGQ